MSSTLLAAFVTAALAANPTPAEGIRTLIATIEELQKPIEDFRCEFEGSTHFLGKVLNDEKTKGKGRVRDDGLVETFAGTFIWKQGGDTLSDGLHRRGIDNTVSRKTLIMNPAENSAEEYIRANDGGIGNTNLTTLSRSRLSQRHTPAFLFKIDDLKRLADDETWVLTVADDQNDGHPLKVVSFALKGAPDRAAMYRWWIDLQRNGHVVRAEDYLSGEGLASTENYELTRVQVGDKNVWMPISVKVVGYGALEDRRPIVTKEPTSTSEVRIIDGTLQFNKHPGPQVFNINYKPGPPVSTPLRQLTQEWDHPKPQPTPTKAELEQTLNEQIARAEQQKAELIATPASQAFDSSPWITAALAAIVLISCVTLWIHRRRS